MVGSGYSPMKNMKRKELDLDEVSNDLHDFSLSSPARKIRRLNAQLPPIMEEEKEQEVVAEMLSSSPVSEEMVSQLQPPVNQERAIVLYRPVNSPVLLQSSSNVSVNLDSLNLVSGFKNEFLRASQCSQMKLAEEEEYVHNKNATTDKSLAVIPWVPSQSQFSYTQGIDVSHTEDPESMEAENEEVEMDIEEQGQEEQGQVYEYGGMRDEGVHQWPQQHCMIPTLAQNTSTPITWFK